MGIPRRKRALLQENDFEDLDPVAKRLINGVIKVDDVDNIIMAELKSWGFGESFIKSLGGSPYIITDTAVTICRIVNLSPKVNVDKTFSNFDKWHNSESTDDSFAVDRAYVEITFPNKIFGLAQKDENLNFVYVGAEFYGHNGKKTYILDAFDDLDMDIGEKMTKIDIHTPDFEKIHEDAIDLIHAAADSLCRSYSNLYDQQREEKGELDSPIEITDD